VTQETQQGETRGQGRHVVLTTFDVGRLNMEARGNQQAFQVSEMPVGTSVNGEADYYDLDS
jgi:hypothetical protein